MLFFLLSPLSKKLSIGCDSNLYLPRSRVVSSDNLGGVNQERLDSTQAMLESKLLSWASSSGGKSSTYLYARSCRLQISIVTFRELNEPGSVIAPVILKRVAGVNCKIDAALPLKTVVSEWVGI